MEEVWPKQLSGSSLILHTSPCSTSQKFSLECNLGSGREDGGVLQDSSAFSTGSNMFWSHQANRKPHRQLHPADLAQLGGWAGWISAGVGKELHPAAMPRSRHAAMPGSTHPAMPGSRRTARGVSHFTTNLAGRWHWSHVSQQPCHPREVTLLRGHARLSTLQTLWQIWSS